MPKAPNKASLHRVTLSARQARMLDLLVEISPWGTKATSVIEFIVARELDMLEETNRFGLRDRIEKGD